MADYYHDDDDDDDDDDTECSKVIISIIIGTVCFDLWYAIALTVRVGGR